MAKLKDVKVSRGEWARIDWTATANGVGIHFRPIGGEARVIAPAGKPKKSKKKQGG